MIELTTEYKQRVLEALFAACENYSGSNAKFARKWGIDETVYSRLNKHGYQDGLLSAGKYVEIGLALNVSPREKQWNIVRTEVFNIIEADVLFCKKYAKGKIFTDKCAIGKTCTGRYLARTVPNCFYIDMRQIGNPTDFAKALAKAIGADHRGRLSAVKERVKYYLKQMPDPIIYLDEGAKIDVKIVDEFIEYYNALDGYCGWYVTGTGSLKTKINNGIEQRIGGYEEMFSRLSDCYSTAVPTDKKERQDFYRRLCGCVLEANMSTPNRGKLNELVVKCLQTEEDGEISGLRRAESLLILSEM